MFFPRSKEVDLFLIVGGMGKESSSCCVVVEVVGSDKFGTLGVVDDDNISTGLGIDPCDSVVTVAVVPFTVDVNAAKVIVRTRNLILSPC